MVNAEVKATSLDVNQINVSDDVYVNNNIYTPVGSIITYAGTTSPGGWLLCDGSEVSKTSYPRLFSVIGTTYGTPGDGDSSKFVLPNLADRVPVGKSGAAAVGGLGGNSSITLSIPQLPAHTHTGSTALNGSHSHSGSISNSGTHNHGIYDPGHVHTQWTTNDDFNNSGGSPPGFAADSAGYRTWSNINTAYTGISINNSGDHTHTLTIADAESHTHEVTIGDTGNGSAIDIRNKFIVLNYIIRY